MAYSTYTNPFDNAENLSTYYDQELEDNIDSDVLSGGVESGTYGLQSSFNNALAAGGRAIGLDSFAQNRELAADIQAQRAAGAGHMIPGLSESESVGDYGNWSLGMIAQNAPLMASLIASGAIGGAAGASLMGKRGLAKGLGRSAREEEVARLVRNAMDGQEVGAMDRILGTTKKKLSSQFEASPERKNVLDAIERQAYEEAAKKSHLRNSISEALQGRAKGTRLGMLAGGALPYFGATTGETYSGLRHDPDASGTLADRGRAAMVAGAAQTGLGMAFEPSIILSKMMRSAKPFTLAGASALGEGVTETGEQLIQQYTQNQYNPNAGYDPAQLLEAGLGGAIVGGAYSILPATLQSMNEKLSARKVSEAMNQQGEAVQETANAFDALGYDYLDTAVMNLNNDDARQSLETQALRSEMLKSLAKRVAEQKPEHINYVYNNIQDQLKWWAEQGYGSAPIVDELIAAAENLRTASPQDVKEPSVRIDKNVREDAGPMSLGDPIESFNNPQTGENVDGTTQETSLSLSGESREEAGGTSSPQGSVFGDQGQGTAANEGSSNLGSPRVTVGPDENSYVNTNAQLERDLADKLGITADIERLAASGLTANEIENSLAPKLQTMNKEARADLVHGTRATLGIPSQMVGDGTEFNAWRDQYNKRMGESLRQRIEEHNKRVGPEARASEQVRSDDTNRQRSTNPLPIGNDYRNGQPRYQAGIQRPQDVTEGKSPLVTYRLATNQKNTLSIPSNISAAINGTEDILYNGETLENSEAIRDEIGRVQEAKQDASERMQQAEADRAEAANAPVDRALMLELRAQRNEEEANILLQENQDLNIEDLFQLARAARPRIAIPEVSQQSSILGALNISDEDTASQEDVATQLNDLLEEERILTEDISDQARAAEGELQDYMLANPDIDPELLADPNEIEAAREIDQHVRELEYEAQRLTNLQLMSPDGVEHQIIAEQINEVENQIKELNRQKPKFEALPLRQQIEMVATGMTDMSTEEISALEERIKRLRGINYRRNKVVSVEVVPPRDPAKPSNLKITDKKTGAQLIIPSTLETLNRDFKIKYRGKTFPAASVIAAISEAHRTGEQLPLRKLLELAQNAYEFRFTTRPRGVSTYRIDPRTDMITERTYTEEMYELRVNPIIEEFGIIPVKLKGNAFSPNFDYIVQKFQDTKNIIVRPFSGNFPSEEEAEAHLARLTFAGVEAVRVGNRIDVIGNSQPMTARDTTELEQVLAELKLNKKDSDGNYERVAVHQKEPMFLLGKMDNQLFFATKKQRAEFVRAFFGEEALKSDINILERAGVITKKESGHMIEYDFSHITGRHGEVTDASGKTTNYHDGVIAIANGATLAQGVSLRKILPLKNKSDRELKPLIEAWWNEQHPGEPYTGISRRKKAQAKEDFINSKWEYETDKGIVRSPISRFTFEIDENGELILHPTKYIEEESLHTDLQFKRKLAETQAESTTWRFNQMFPPSPEKSGTANVQQLFFAAVNAVGAFAKDTLRLAKMELSEMLEGDNAARFSHGVPGGMLLNIGQIIKQAKNIKASTTRAYAMSVDDKVLPQTKKDSGITPARYEEIERDFKRMRGEQRGYRPGLDDVLFAPNTYKELDEQWVKEKGRHLQVGDVVLLNRDPALPDGSSMAPFVFLGIGQLENPRGSFDRGIIVHTLSESFNDMAGDFDGDSAVALIPNADIEPRPIVKQPSNQPKLEYLKKGNGVADTVQSVLNRYKRAYQVTGANVAVDKHGSPSILDWTLVISDGQGNIQREEDMLTALSAYHSSDYSQKVGMIMSIAQWLGEIGHLNFNLEMPILDPKTGIPFKTRDAEGNEVNATYMVPVRVVLAVLGQGSISAKKKPAWANEALAQLETIKETVQRDHAPRKENLITGDVLTRVVRGEEVEITEPFLIQALKSVEDAPVPGSISARLRRQSIMNSPRGRLFEEADNGMDSFGMPADKEEAWTQAVIIARRVLAMHRRNMLGRIGTVYNSLNAVDKLSVQNIVLKDINEFLKSGGFIQTDLANGAAVTSFLRNHPAIRLSDEIMHKLEAIPGLYERPRPRESLAYRILALNEKVEELDLFADTTIMPAHKEAARQLLLKQKEEAIAEINSRPVNQQTADEINAYLSKFDVDRNVNVIKGWQLALTEAGQTLSGLDPITEEAEYKAVRRRITEINNEIKSNYVAGMVTAEELIAHGIKKAMAFIDIEKLAEINKQSTQTTIDEEVALSVEGYDADGNVIPQGQIPAGYYTINDQGIMELKEAFDKDNNQHEYVRLVPSKVVEDREKENKRQKLMSLKSKPIDETNPEAMDSMHDPNTLVVKILRTTAQGGSTYISIGNPDRWGMAYKDASIHDDVETPVGMLMPEFDRASAMTSNAIFNKNDYDVALLQSNPEQVVLAHGTHSADAKDRTGRELKWLEKWRKGKRFFTVSKPGQASNQRYVYVNDMRLENGRVTFSATFLGTNKEAAQVAAHYLGFTENYTAPGPQARASEQTPTARASMQRPDTVKMSSKMTFPFKRGTKRPEVSANDTFDAILDGQRTSTLRFDGWKGTGRWAEISPGDVVKFTSATGSELLARVKSVQRFEDASTELDPSQVSLTEGWTAEHLSNEFRRHQGGYYIKYELVKTGTPLEIKASEYKDSVYDYLMLAKGDELTAVHRAIVKKVVLGPEPVDDIEKHAVWAAHKSWMEEREYINDREARMQAVANGVDTRFVDTKGNVRELSGDQANVLADMLLMREGSTPYQVLRIIGPAGTGKTTLVRELMRRWRYMHGEGGVKLATPTHRANWVMKSMSAYKRLVEGKEFLSESEPISVHSLLGARHNEKTRHLDILSLKEGAAKQVPISLMRRGEALIIDEASFLDEDSVARLREWQREIGFSLIFMGDDQQLPPVKKENSPIFETDIEERRLNQVMRQKGSNPLLDYLTNLRNDVKQALVTKYNKNTHEGIITVGNRAALQFRLAKMFTDNILLANRNHVRIITPTNESVREWNEHMHKLIHPEDGFRMTVGEVAIGYRNGPGVKNGVEYIITGIEHDKVRISIEGIPFRGSSVSLTDNSGKTIASFMIDPSEDTKYADLIVERAKRLNDIHKEATRIKDYTLYNDTREAYEKDQGEIVSMRDIKHNGTVYDAEEKDNVLLRRMFDLAYATTVHKAQGGTVNIAVVDNDAMARFPGKHDFKRKLTYTAYSRPSKTVIVVGDGLTESADELNHLLDAAAKPEFYTQEEENLPIEQSDLYGHTRYDQIPMGQEEGPEARASKMLRTREQLEADAARSERMRREQWVIDYEKDDILAAIAKLGGIDIEDAKLSGFTDYTHRRGSGIHRVFSAVNDATDPKKGHSFDAMRELLLGHRYTAGETEADFVNILTDALTGANPDQDLYSQHRSDAAIAAAMDSREQTWRENQEAGEGEGDWYDDTPDNRALAAISMSPERLAEVQDSVDNLAMLMGLGSPIRVVTAREMHDVLVDTGKADKAAGILEHGHFTQAGERGGTRGMHYVVKGEHILYISAAMEAEEQAVVMSHEHGHAIIDMEAENLYRTNPTLFNQILKEFKDTTGEEHGFKDNAPRRSNRAKDLHEIINSIAFDKRDEVHEQALVEISNHDDLEQLATFAKDQIARSKLPYSKEMELVGYMESEAQAAEDRIDEILATEQDVRRLNNLLKQYKKYNDWVKSPNHKMKVNPLSGELAQRVENRIEELNNQGIYEAPGIEMSSEFHEWLADRIGIWLTTAEAPTTAGDTWFKSVADKLKRFFVESVERLMALFQLAEPPVALVSINEWMSGLVKPNDQLEREYGPINTPGETLTSRLQRKQLRIKNWAQNPDNPDIWALNEVALQVKNDLDKLLPAREAKLLRDTASAPAMKRRIMQLIGQDSVAAQRMEFDDNLTVAYFYALTTTKILRPSSPGNILQRALANLNNSLRDANRMILEATPEEVDGMARALNLHGEVLKSDPNAELGPIFPAGSPAARLYAASQQRYARGVMGAAQQALMGYNNVVGDYINVPYQLILQTGNQELINMAKVIQPMAWELNGFKSAGYIERQRVQYQRFTGRAAEIIKDLDETQREELKQLLYPLSGGKKPKVSDKAAIAVQQLRDLLKYMYDFADNSGLRIEERQKYWPFLPNKEYIANNMAEVVNTYSSDPSWFINWGVPGAQNPQGWTKVHRDYVQWIKDNGDPGQYATVTEAVLAVENMQPKEFIQFYLTNDDRHMLPGWKLEQLEDEKNSTPGFRFANPRLLDFLLHSPDKATHEKVLSTLHTDISHVLQAYIRNTSKRVEYENLVSGLGPDGFKGVWERARATGATDAQIRLAIKYIDTVHGMLGLKERDRLDRLIDKAGPDSMLAPLKSEGGIMNDKINNTMSWTIAAVDVAHLTLTAFTSLVDPLGTLVRADGNYKTFMQGFKAMRRNQKRELAKLSPTAQQRFIHLIGAHNTAFTNSDILATYFGAETPPAVQRFLGWYFKVIGVEAISNFTSDLAQRTGYLFVLDLKEKADSGDAEARAELHNLGVTPDDIKLTPEGDMIILDWEGIVNASPEENERDLRVRNAVMRFVEESQVRPNATARPFWMSNPYYRLLSIWRGFMSSFDNQIMRPVYSRLIQNGDMKPVAAMALAFIPVMLIAEGLRDQVRGLADGDDDELLSWNTPSWKNGFTLADFAEQAVQKSGFYGRHEIVSDIAAPLFQGDARKAAAEVGGVFTSDVDKMLKYGKFPLLPASDLVKWDKI